MKLYIIKSSSPSPLERGWGEVICNQQSFQGFKGAILLSLLLLWVNICHAQYKQAVNTSKTWVADNGDGTYTNPVLHADYSDPDAIRVGDDFYMVSSSFEDIPGLPILHSKDLVNWQLL